MKSKLFLFALLLMMVYNIRAQVKRQLISIEAKPDTEKKIYPIASLNFNKIIPYTTAELSKFFGGLILDNIQETLSQSCGAPDFILTKKDIPVGFIEAKDIGDKDLKGAKKTGNKEQFDRYKKSLSNLIFKST